MRLQWHARSVWMLLAAAIAAFFAFVPRAGSAQSQGAPAALPGWQQVNSGGFGVPQTDEVSALSAFGGYLYAGTSNPVDGARIYRSLDGTAWTPLTEPGFGIEHDIAPPAILAMTVYGGRIYASTGRGDGPGQIWRSLDGVYWAPMVIHGFSDQDNVDVTAFAAYDNKLFAGVTNLASGAQIWSSDTGDSNTWTQAAPAAPGTDTATVSGLAEFDGALYAAIESAAPAQIWRAHGVTWTTVVDDGFGDSRTTLTGGMAVFGGYLYAGAGNTAGGAQLWRSGDGETWEQVGDPAFAGAGNEEVESLFVHQNHLYAGIKNSVTGVQLWRSPNGTQWERANQDGFGAANNSGSNLSNAQAVFLGRLYVGTANAVDGGELWRMQQPWGVTLSPDSTLAAPPGEQVIHTLTITNTGESADTFTLAAAGHAWATSLAASVAGLAPSAGASLTVTVTIPPGAADQATDTVTVTATSHGDGSVADSVRLTTTARRAPANGHVAYLCMVFASTPARVATPVSAR